MVDINNVYPDYEDEEWVSRVTNWEEFWYESEDILDLEDEDVSAAEQSMQAMNRACEYELLSPIIHPQLAFLRLEIVCFTTNHRWRSVVIGQAHCDSRRAGGARPARLHCSCTYSTVQPPAVLEAGSS
jgi:hypothetical protein